ncbi:MAG: OmpA family protein [Lentimicrobiaceae bacterium]|nr:OmpA family protein [Lentimicrobiaceae bacterium]
MKKYIIVAVCILGCAYGNLSAQKGYPCEITLSKKAQTLFSKARAAQNKGENSKATALFLECTEEQEDWAAPYYALAMQEIRKLERAETKTDNMFQSAIGYFEKSAALCPDYNVLAYLHLGKLYYSINRYDKAVLNLELFLEEPDKVKNDKDLDEAEYFLQYSIVYEKLYGAPVPYNPQPVRGMSTSDDEYTGVISPDDEYMLYTRKKTITTEQYRVKKTEEVEFFTISRQNDDGSFTVGEPMPSPPFNMSKNEGTPTITLDNKYLVFTRCTDNPDIQLPNGKPYYNCDLYFAEYINGEWTEIQNLGPAVNRPNSWESQASISADGQILFFASDRKGGCCDTVYGTDIYFSVRDANGNWQEAQNLGCTVNTIGSEKTPFIHSDGKTLYFSSNGYTGLGGYDIYVTRLSEKGVWQKPVNIGYPINSERDELGLFVNTAGNKAYFTSNRFSGNLDICEFELYDAARPNKVILVKGQVESKDKEQTIKVELQNIATKQIQSLNVDEFTGKYAAIINNTDNDFLLTVKQKDHVYETKYIDSKKITESNQPIVKDVDFTLETIDIGKSYNINDIYFATNSYELNEVSMSVLNTLIDFLNDNLSVQIEIQGHTDNIGNRSDNMILSDNRAKEVYNYLIANHIEKHRLKYKGFADTKPIADNSTETGRAKNRRTVFVIVSK